MSSALVEGRNFTSPPKLPPKDKRCISSVFDLLTGTELYTLAQADADKDPYLRQMMGDVPKEVRPHVLISYFISSI